MKSAVLCFVVLVLLPCPILARESEAITLALPDTALVINDIPEAFPLSVTNFDGIGSLSLRIAFADTVLSYLQVVSQVPGVSFQSNVVGGEVAIDWQDASGENPLSIGTGVLLNLEFFLIGDTDDVSPLDFTPACALADSVGNPIGGVVYVDGSCTLLGSVSAEELAAGPAGFALRACGPNPFVNATVIRYELPRATDVALRVYDASGRLVRVIEEARRQAGNHARTWDGRDEAGRRVAPGVYFYRLDTDGFTGTGKTVLIR